MLRKVAAIDKRPAEKSSARTPQTCTSTMSISSRGAIARALRPDALRILFRAYSRQVTPTIYPRFRSTRTFSSIKSVNVGQQTATPQRAFSTSRFLQSEASKQILVDSLPVCCPGCGAFSQTIEPDEPGYYGKSRKQRRKPSKKDNTEQQTTESGDLTVLSTQDIPGEDHAHPTEESTAPKPIQGKPLTSIHIAPVLW